MKLSFLYGITFGPWVRLLIRTGYNFPPRYLPRVILFSLVALFNSFTRFFEDLLYKQKINNYKLPEAPIFILGHWRGGTTHLHYILDQDINLVAPNTYQVLNPHNFLTTERVNTRLYAPLMPGVRPQDNMSGGFAYPNEDEIALCVTSALSPYLGFPFPDKELYFRRYFSLRELSALERENWKASLLFFLKKVSYKSGGKRLVVKSPAHTFRIKTLLEIFPDARFIHIRRNPYDIFSSSRYLYLTWRDKFAFLQKPDTDDESIAERILTVYKNMYDVFFEEQKLIPAGHFHELSYEELVQNPVQEIRKIYENLDLPDFRKFRPELEKYLSRVADYKTIKHRRLAESERQAIQKAWERNFKAWGYKT